MQLRILVFSIFLFTQVFSQSGKKSAQISGTVFGENDLPLSSVSVQLLGKTSGTVTDANGKFILAVPSGKAFALVFTHMGYKDLQRSFWLNQGEEETISIQMEKGSQELNAVIVNEQHSRKEAGLVVLNPKAALNIPTALGGIESMIKVIVGSNNELSSQYTVRGGNYDENLVYVNDFEVFRPYLVRSGQQEGLSFINPELTRNVNFYNGGFQARYGDKMSSVLDIQYKKPKKFGGSAYVSLLEQGLHVEGSDKKNKFTYLIGVRNRSNRSLVGSQATKGNYVPSSSDLQALLTWQLNEKNSLEWLSNLSFTGFRLQPAFSQLTSSVFSPYFSANLGLDILFEGEESDGYKTQMNGLSWNYQPNKKLRLKWMASRFTDQENESIDIIGAYLFGEREFDKSKADFGLIKNPLGSGLFLNHARNNLDIGIWNLSHKGSFDNNQHFFQWGLTAERQQVNDKLHEWEYMDSAGYNVPYNPDQLVMSKFLSSKIHLLATRISGYLQDNIYLNEKNDFSLQAGIRFNYNNLNHELLLSPRLCLSWKPSSWNKNIIFRGAAGLYQQPPFYRELRRYDGTVNTNLKAQKSWQITGGMDYSFKMGDRPLRFTTEAYYKNIWDVVPYDLDNVRIRYFGENQAKAYATGIETRLFGELVKDAESWVSIGFMKTAENLTNDHYYNYKADSLGQITDSTRLEGGWFRRPSDRFFTMGLFIQDYLSTNKNFKVSLNLLYGSNLPYNIPGSIKYRNGLIIPSYIRMDLGFSVLLLDSERTNRRSHNPFRDFDNIWASLEVFNMIDRDNTISYLLIKDFSNTVFAMPNRLTPRLLNLKLVARF